MPHFGRSFVWLAPIFVSCSNLYSQTTTLPSTTAPASAQPFAVSEADIVLLVKTVRAALRDTLAARPEQPARYRPATLKGLKAILCATLRQNGGAVADAQSGEVDLVDGAVAVGALMGQAIIARKLNLPDHGDHCGLELEWLGPPEFVALGFDDRGKWTEELLHCFEPGVEGIGVEFRGKRGWTRPSQVISLNYTPDVSIQAAEKAADLKQIDKLNSAKEIRYFRFRSRQVWQADAMSRPVTLTRGDIPVMPEAVTVEGLDLVIGRMGRYLQYRQNRDGWYSEEYLPSVDRYTQGNSAAVQMHALQGLAAYASWSGDKEGQDAAAKGLGRSATFLTPFLITARTPSSQSAGGQPASAPAATTQAGAVLAFPGHASYLEISARLLGAMLDLPEHKEFDAARRSLIDAILASQDEEGRLEMIFGPRNADAPDDAIAAGAGLWALARSNLWRTDQRIDPCLTRAALYYRKWFDRSADSGGGTALVPAMFQAYAITNDAHISDLAFAVLDRLISLQFSSSNCAWPELYGAFNLHEPGIVGFDSATCLAALSDGLRLAERVGDPGRTKHYARAARMAARFVMQLEVREESAYYVRSCIDSLGGVRTAPWNNAIRADHCAEAVMALIQARSALFGPRP